MENSETVEGKRREKKKLHHMQHNEKLIILNVIKFFDDEKLNNAPAVPFAYSVKRAAAATGVSESTIKRLRRLLESGTADSGISLGPKRRLRARKILIDDTKICAIRRKITEFYIDKKEVPSLKKLLPLLKEEIMYEGGREHLRKLLLDIGFKFKKCADKRHVMMERSDIVATRSRYLRTIRLNDSLCERRKPVWYLDETYVGPSLTVSKDRKTKDTAVTEEYRWVIIHAARCDAYIPGNTLIYNSRSKTGEPHDNTDIKHFSNWITEKIMPCMTEPSIVVVVNAPYYLTRMFQNLPLPSAKKQILQDWLTTNQVKFVADMRNAELYELIQQHKPPIKHVADELFKMHGHEVLYLPSFHGSLSPVEFMWNVLKNRLGVIDRTLFKSVNDMAKLINNAFYTISPEDWLRHVWAVKNLEFQYWNRDSQMEEEITRLGITDDSDDELSSDDDDSKTISKKST